MAELKLKKPFKLDGEEVSVLKYDLDEMTGADIDRAIAELGKRNIVPIVPETDKRYLAMLFAINSGIAYEDLNRLPARDYAAMTSAVRDFFLED